MRLPPARFSSVALAFTLSIPAFAHAPPEFEVASIKPSGDPGPTRAQAGIRIDGAQFTASFFSLRDYIGIAYSLKSYQITGPDWISSLRFDIAAKLPAGASRKDVPEMLKALLADRFQLKLHHDKKEFAVYALVASKGAVSLKVSADMTEGNGNVNVAGGGDANGTSVNLGNGAGYTFGSEKFDGRKLTMAVFADNLARFVDRPVVDMTGLTAAYDFSLPVTPEDFRAMQIRSGMNAGVVLPPQVIQMAESSYDSLHASLAKVGLKLEQRKAPLDIVVVDRAEKTARAN